jgi:hypothetical protein
LNARSQYRNIQNSRGHSKNIWIAAVELIHLASSNRQFMRFQKDLFLARTNVGQDPLTGGKMRLAAVAPYRHWAG